MEKFEKIVEGVVVQTFEKDVNGFFVCTGQEFIASDNVYYENIKHDPIKAPDYGYQPFNMTL